MSEVAVPVKSGNDATDLLIASANCSYCAVGGLVGASANEVMADVYRLFGAAAPANGMADDGANGFAKLYAHRTGQKLSLDNSQAFQVEGVVAYLELKGCTVRRIGSVKDLKNSAELNAAANELGNGALFLAMTGDEDIVGSGITSLAHWTIGQVQGGKAQYYDYQLKCPDKMVQYAVRRKAGISIGETGMTDYPVVAWGQKLDEDDGRGLLLVVSKVKKG